MTKSDKGGATVILDVEDYIAKVNDQFENNLFYQRVNGDSKQNTLKLLIQLLKNLRNKNF